MAEHIGRCIPYNSERLSNVLHCFQKKSARGIATSRQDMDCIKTRLKVAAQDAQEKGHE